MLADTLLSFLIWVAVLDAKMAALSRFQRPALCPCRLARLLALKMRCLQAMYEAVLRCLVPLTLARYCSNVRCLPRWRIGSNVFNIFSLCTVIGRGAPFFRVLSRPRPSLAFDAIDGHGVFLWFDVIVPKVQWTIDEVYSQC